MIMKKRLYTAILLLFILAPQKGNSQINQDQVGAWYMYFFNTTFKESPWGFQGDIQYRNWNLGGDLEQLLLRGGLTYTPKNASILFTLGYAHISTGAFDSSEIIAREI